MTSIISSSLTALIFVFFNYVIGLGRLESAVMAFVFVMPLIRVIATLVVNNQKDNF